MKTALVTGANRGIGLEIAKQLAENNCKVYLGCRNLEKGKEALKEVQGNAELLQIDVSSFESIEQAVQELSEKEQKLDVLINNAGLGVGKASASEPDFAEVNQIFEVNFFGAWKLSTSLLPLLKQSKDGRIVNLSSGMAERSAIAEGGYAGYRLSKYALNGLTQLLAHELATEVKVYAMCPGWIKTDMGGPNAVRTVEKGAETALWLALSDDEIQSGLFYRDKAVIED